MSDSTTPKVFEATDKNGRNVLYMLDESWQLLFSAGEDRWIIASGFCVGLRTPSELRAIASCMESEVQS